MNTSISTKLAALALALMVNSVIMGGIAYLFNTAAAADHGGHLAREHEQHCDDQIGLSGSDLGALVD